MTTAATNIHRQVVSQLEKEPQQLILDNKIEQQVQFNPTSLDKILRTDDILNYKRSYAIVMGRFPLVLEEMIDDKSKIRPVIRLENNEIRLQSVNWEYLEYIEHLNQVSFFVNQNKIDKIVATGGATSKNYPTLTEGKTMKDFFLGSLKIKPDHTFNSEQILVEDKSMRSYENIRNAIIKIEDVNKDENIEFNECNLIFFCRSSLFARVTENAMIYALKMTVEQQSRYLQNEYELRVNETIPSVAVSTLTHLQKKLGVTLGRLNEGMRISIDPEKIKSGNVIVLPFREQIQSLKHLEAIGDHFSLLKDTLDKKLYPEKF